MYWFSLPKSISTISIYDFLLRLIDLPGQARRHHTMTLTKTLADTFSVKFFSINKDKETSSFTPADLFYIFFPVMFEQIADHLVP